MNRKPNLLDAKISLQYRASYALGAIVGGYGIARHRLTTLSHLVGQAFKH